jgi:hypothetical protein
MAHVLLIDARGTPQGFRKMRTELAHANVAKVTQWTAY